MFIWNVGGGWHKVIIFAHSINNKSFWNMSCEVINNAKIEYLFFIKVNLDIIPAFLNLVCGHPCPQQFYHYKLYWFLKVSYGSLKKCPILPQYRIETVRGFSQFPKCVMLCNNVRENINQLKLFSANSHLIYNLWGVIGRLEMIHKQKFYTFRYNKNRIYHRPLIAWKISR